MDAEPKSDAGPSGAGGSAGANGAPPSVSLPKGGGAIRGIGEKFSVSAATGTGAFTVPVYTSPGRSGFTPTLSLSYNSGSGNGAFGLGWRLSVPSVTRKTDKGLPRYDDAGQPDVFLLSDAEDLMPLLTLQAGVWQPPADAPRTWGALSYSVRRYRPRVEGPFARIERWTDTASGAVHWRATAKDNMTNLYGFDPSCRLADPNDPTRVFQWLLEATFDDRGNVAYYEYKAEDRTGVAVAAANERNRLNGYSPCANLYAKRIHYGNRAPYAPGEDLSRRTDWLFEVVFDYGEHNPTLPTPAEDPARTWATRADPFSSFRSTFEVRTYRLCQRVLMFHHVPPGPSGEAGYDGLARSTDLSYGQTDPLSPLQGDPVATKLIAVTSTGYLPGAANTPYLTRSFPPLQFTYSEAQIDPTVLTVDPESLENLPMGADASNYQWLDLDGEGLPGIVAQQGGALWYKRNTSPAHQVTVDGLSRTLARFAPLEKLGTQPAPVLAGAPPRFMDLASGGHQDLVQLDGPVRGYYERGDSRQWSGFAAFQSFPNLDTRDPNVKFADIDGDGLADILVSEDEVMAWYPSLGTMGFADRRYARKPYDEERGPVLLFSDPTQSIFLADMTGDGLTDIVRIRNGDVCYWPNRGYGRFGAKVAMDGAPAFETPDLFDPRRIRLADIDGCGTTDILYLAARGVAVFHNQSGNSWSAETTLANFPALSQLASVAAVDLLGTGTTCLVWSSSLPADGGRQMRYMDLMGGVKPHLLVGVANNLGAETRVRYVSSTQFYMQDLEAGTPWVTRLAFPVQVVDRLEIFDHVGRTRLVSTFSYRHGFYDPVEREFRGFGYVEQQDAESFGDSGSLFTEDTDTEADALHAPPVVTKTWFHTGAWPDGETVAHLMARDYFGAPDPSDPAFPAKWAAYLATLIPDTVLPTDLLQGDGTRLPYALTGEEQREAIRALKGSILRQEIYASDGTPMASLPYSISSRNYTLEVLQPKGANPYGVYFTHDRETIERHLERNPADPRVAHGAVLAVDPFGNVLQKVSVAYGRNLAGSGLPAAPAPAPNAAPDLSVDASGFVQPEQLGALLTLAENAYTVAIDSPAAYRGPMPSEASAYQLTRPVRPDESVLYLFSDLASLVSAAGEIAYEAAVDSTLVQKRLTSRTRTLYYKDDLSGPAPLGSLESRGLVFESYRLAMTGGFAEQVFITGNSNPNRPANAAALGAILADTGSVVAGVFTNQGGGYVGSGGDGNFWIPSGRSLFCPVPPNPPDPPVQSAAVAAATFFLPQAKRDPFGQYLRLGYDSFNLVLARTEDALGSVVIGATDYRVLLPFDVADPNGNHVQVAFDALGLVVGSAILGKVTAGVGESGDSLSGLDPSVAQATIDGFIASPNPAVLAPALLGAATTRFLYDLGRFSASQAASPGDPTQWKPAFVATLAREIHTADLGPAATTPIQISVSFSDGMGREIQKKGQAEPGPLDLAQLNAPVISPRWTCSGWVILDNKARPVRRYDPFFSATQDFEFANKVGVTSTLFYDSLGRGVATLSPDNTWAKVVFNPWQQVTWDQNDTVALDPKADPDVGELLARLPDPDYLPTWYQLRTNPASAAAAFPDPALRALEVDAAGKAAAHGGTPSVALFDGLGRSFLSVAHNRGPVNGITTDQFFATRTLLDISGNALAVIDALGRKVEACDFDPLGSKVHCRSMDGGERWILANVSRQSIRLWDGRGYLRSMAYDELVRPIGVYASGNGLTNVLAEKLIYGDSRVGAPANPQAINCVGRIYQAFDGAGTIESAGANPATKALEGYDFRGNLLRSTRRLVQGYKVQVDWSQGPALSGETFTRAARYDALNRLTQQIAPHSDAAGTLVNVVRPGYNEASLLTSIDAWLQQAAEPTGLLDPSGATTHILTDVEYDQKAQRTLAAYGSGASAAFTYDPRTFRLTRILTTRKADGVSLQDLQYVDDPVGNVTHVQDDADIQNVVYFKNKRVEPSADFTYDAVYQLIGATGREHLGQNGGVPNAPAPQSYNDWGNINLPHPNDGNAMGTYAESFAYDAVGNIQLLKHAGSSPANPGWNRTYAYNEASQVEAARQGNRLSATTVGGVTETYSSAGNGYDAHGNFLKMPQLQVLQWDFKDQLQMTQRQAVNADDTDGTAHQGERTYYLYNSSGDRVAKATESSLGVLVKLRINLGGFELYREFGVGPAPTLERQTLHAMDSARRVSLIEMRTLGNDGTPAQLGRTQFSNLVGSACLELDDQAQVISYEEYYPFGSTAYQAVSGSISPAAKRYRFTGMERDEESGLEFHGARYYAPWLGRWISADPAGLADGTNLYRYARNAPTRLLDPGGTQSKDPPDLPAKGDDDPAPDPVQAQPENTGNSATAIVQPEGTATSEFTAQGSTGGGSSTGTLLYHYRYVVAKEVEAGLQLGYGGVYHGPALTLINATLHLGKEYDQFKLTDTFLKANGWTFGVGLLGGQNPTLTSTLFPDQAPDQVGGPNPVASAQYARSYLKSEIQGKTQPHLHLLHEVDINFGVTAQRYGSINGVTVEGLVVGALVVNYAKNDWPTDNWQTNVELTEAGNVGIGGALADPGGPSLSGSGLKSWSGSETTTLGVGISRAWDDYAITIEGYVQKEGYSNVSAGGDTGTFGSGALTGGVRVDLTAINKPKNSSGP
jgi:RHS repeat-associated protein